MNITWNAKEYQKGFNFVYAYGEDVLNLLDLPKDSFIVDCGCGNGELTAKIKEKGYRVLGLDGSENMIALAKKNHPDIEFKYGDIVNFKLDKKADGIFSNAVLHWIDKNKQEIMLKNIAANLVDGGTFVFEFGGYGCAESVHATLEKIFAKYGLSYERMFYFPTIGMYAPMLEQAGFKVEYGTLFDRFTKQSDSGLAGWIKMFDKKPFENVADDLTEKIIAEAQEQLKDKLYKDGSWYVDYVRLRMKCRKLA